MDTRVLSPKYEGSWMVYHMHITNPTLSISKDRCQIVLETWTPCVKISSVYVAQMPTYGEISNLHNTMWFW